MPPRIPNTVFRDRSHSKLSKDAVATPWRQGEPSILPIDTHSLSHVYRTSSSVDEAAAAGSPKLSTPWQRGVAPREDGRAACGSSVVGAREWRLPVSRDRTSRRAPCSEREQTPSAHLASLQDPLSENGQTVHPPTKHSGSTAPTSSILAPWNPRGSCRHARNAAAIRPDLSRDTDQPAEGPSVFAATK